MIPYNTMDFSRYGIAIDEILVYLRKSRSDDPLLSVEEVLQKHESMLDEWAERNLGATVPEQNKYREVVSGETIEDRPEVQKLLKKIESPKYKAILIVEIQRLSRGDLEDAGRLIKILRYTKTIVITPQKIYDLQDEYDREFFERELKRGNEFLEYQKKIMNRGKLLSVSQGNFIASMPPYGYDRTTVKDGKRECPTLKINEEQANVVRMIYDMYVNKNMTPNAICNYLDDMAIKPPRGKHWSAISMRDMLSNIHYIGKVRWNWRQTVTTVEDGEYVKSRPKNKFGEYLIYDGRHEPIITEELFYAALEKHGKNPRVKSRAKITNPFAGLIWCHCGRAIVYRPYNDGKSIPRLLCGDQKHCGCGSCTFEDMVERVSEVLEQCIKDFEIRIDNNTGDSVKMHKELIKSLEKRQEDLKKREMYLWEQRSNPDPLLRLPDDMFKEMNANLQEEKEEVRSALCNAYDSMPEPIDYEEQLHRFTDALNALRDDTVDAAQKNKLLKACIDRIEYHRDKPQRLNAEGWKAMFGDAPPTLKSGGGWTNPPIELDIKLRV